MTRGKKTNQNNANGPEDREPGDLIELLKNFYQPDTEDIENFDDFYQSIEAKLNTQNPVNKISQASDELEVKYKKRQKKFEDFINQLEDNLNTSRKQLLKRSEKRKKLTIVIVSLVALLALGFAYIYLRSNYIDINADGKQIVLKIKKPTGSPQLKL